MRRWRWAPVAVVCYALMVLVAGGVAAARLSHSTEMPGLAGIELVLLALPWSLLLGQPPITHASLSLASLLVGGGLLLNAVVLHRAIGSLERLWHRRQERRAA
jgi:hypothetical protein